MSQTRKPAVRGGHLSAESLLLGGPVRSEQDDDRRRFPTTGYDADPYRLPRASPAPTKPLRDLSDMLPPPDVRRGVDDWGRSERVYQLIEPLLNFYYRYWFRVEVEGIENVPATGGALLASNHSGALPPDAPMIMQAIRNEHSQPRPVYVLGENWFRAYPGIGMLANKIGLIPAHPENARRLLHDEGRLVLVFPEGQKGTRKLYWQRYKLRRFGRGGFVRTAIRSGVPIVPAAVVGAEEAMPIFAQLPLLQRLTGLIYFPINHAFPQFGPLAGLMYLPAKFKIRFLEPVRFDHRGPGAADDLAFVAQAAEDVRARIQTALDEMLGARTSVWFG